MLWDCCLKHLVQPPRRHITVASALAPPPPAARALADAPQALAWSSGPSQATYTDMLCWLRRPARPACWRRLAIDPGNPRCSVTSSSPTSTPSSRALVAATARRRPANRAASIERRSTGLRGVCGGGGRGQRSRPARPGQRVLPSSPESA